MEEIAIEQKQANKYDKIVKENMESILPVFIKDVLNFDITGSTKFFNQLRILLQLRKYNIDQKFKNMFSVSDFFKPEKDFLYKDGVIVGMAKGIAKGEAKVAKVQQKFARILKDLGHEVAFISSKLEIPEENVMKMLNTRIRKVS
jgi:hypothetical protein